MTTRDGGVFRDRRLILYAPKLTQLESTTSILRTASCAPLGPGYSDLERVVSRTTRDGCLPGGHLPTILLVPVFAPGECGRDREGRSLLSIVTPWWREDFQ